MTDDGTDDRRRTNMWIILEGCDGTGKTTLADRLEHRLDAMGMEPTQRTAHAKLRQHPLVEYAYDYNVLRPVDTPLITDRHYFGEMIYGPLWRDKSEITPAMRRYLNLFLARQGAVVVFLDLPEGEVRKRLASRGEELLSMEHVDLVLRQYRLVAEDTRRSRVPTIWLQNPPDEIDLSRIINLARVASVGAQHVDQYKSFIGHRQPDVLLLGDEWNPHDTLPQMPGCFAPVSGTSGDYLFTALPDSFWRAQRVALANANNESNLGDLWSTLNRPKTVFLGKRARDTATLARIPGEMVPHPQWWRRFHHYEFDRYHSVITDTIEELDYA